MSEGTQDASAIVKEAKAQLDAQEARYAGPHNAVEGVGTGLSSAVGGTVLGVGSIVLGPVIGVSAGVAQGKSSGGTVGGVAGGVVGGGAGLLGGVAVGAVAIVGGIGAGVLALGRGVKESGKTAAEKLHLRHKADESESKKPAEQADVEAYEAERKAYYDKVLGSDAAPSGADSDPDTLPPPVETSLYELLQVSVDASPAALRKAYYKRAQESHPDKHHDNPEAAGEKFQQVAEAYAVLSDPVLRRRYHEYGREAATKVDGAGSVEIDPRALFEVMFGHAKFRHLVGDLAQVSVARMEFSTPRDHSDLKESMIKFQQERVAELCEFLKARIDGQPLEELVALAQREVDVLRTELYGVDMLHTIGYVYVHKGKQLSSGSNDPIGLVGFWRSMEEAGHLYKLKHRALGTAMRGQIESVQSKAETVDEREHEQVLTMLGTMWTLSIVDIETTLREVIQKVCRDPGATAEMQQQRANAIIAIGEVFNKA
mmetsp:Transcript_31734/g.77714  ORF Transcript_31734/g.77714 Transcript_31734/m.77714 type:complete len:485 (-) Transcript_31734:40-1494(-)